MLVQGGGLDVREATDNDAGGELSTERRRRASSGQHVHGAGGHHQLLADTDPSVRPDPAGHHARRLDQSGTIYHQSIPTASDRLTPRTLAYLYYIGRMAPRAPVQLCNKNSSGDEIANVNFYAVRPEATRIR